MSTKTMLAGLVCVVAIACIIAFAVLKKQADDKIKELKKRPKTCPTAPVCPECTVYPPCPDVQCTCPPCRRILESAPVGPSRVPSDVEPPSEQPTTGAPEAPIINPQTPTTEQPSNRRGIYIKHFASGKYLNPEAPFVASPGFAAHQFVGRLQDAPVMVSVNRGATGNAEASSLHGWGLVRSSANAEFQLFRSGPGYRIRNRSLSRVNAFKRCTGPESRCDDLVFNISEGDLFVIENPPAQ